MWPGAGRFWLIPEPVQRGIALCLLHLSPFLLLNPNLPICRAQMDKTQSLSFSQGVCRGAVDATPRLVGEGRWKGVLKCPRARSPFCRSW